MSHCKVKECYEYVYDGSPFCSEHEYLEPASYRVKRLQDYSEGLEYRVSELEEDVKELKRQLGLE